MTATLPRSFFMQKKLKKKILRETTILNKRDENSEITIETFFPFCWTLIKNQCMLSITLKKYYSSPLKKTLKKQNKKNIYNFKFLRI